jgi:hypothetical protein
MMYLAVSADGSAIIPTAAAAEFAQEHLEFVVEQPSWPFNESELTENITHWPGVWLRRSENYLE